MFQTFVWSYVGYRAGEGMIVLFGFGLLVIRITVFGVAGEQFHGDSDGKDDDNLGSQSVLDCYSSEG